MSLFLSKLLPPFLYPLSAALLIGATALTLSFTHWRRIAQVLLGCALAALWIPATPIFANWLNWHVESEVPWVSPDSLPQSDAVVLLGGTPVGRIVRALRLYRAGKAPFIVITGGNLPWQKAGVPEALRVADFLIEIGTPRSVLIVETRSRNTRENAVNTAAIFKEHGWRRGLLVTERVNMPRALATFQKVGIDVTPAVTSVSAGSLQLQHDLFDFLPSVEALSWTTSAIKEIIGLSYYRYRGWA